LNQESRVSASHWNRRLVGARLALGRTARRVGGSLRAPAIVLGSALSKKPTRLVIAPQDLRTADPTVAGDVYSGHFAFAGRIVSTGGHSPFEIEPPSRGWAIGLYGLGWLRHLRAADTALARAQARALVDDFLTLDQPFPVAWETPVLARRIISLISQSPLLLDGAELAFYQRFLRSLDRHIVRLKRRLASEPPGLARLQGAVALVYAALAFDNGAGLLSRATTELERELRAQILPDGGHVSRSPRSLVELILDLLPLRQSFAARNLQQPEILTQSVARILPMLRLLRHSEGSLALFHGAGAMPRDWLATVALYDHAQTGIPESAPASGYQRLAAGDAVLIVDAGPPPRPIHAGRAHASALAFEFSSGASRILVNCGAPLDPAADHAFAVRATAAHNAAIVADTSSCRFAEKPVGGELPILAGPGEVEVTRNTTDTEISLVATHDGYRETFGLVHRRRLALQAEGATLEGEDEFIGTPTGERDDVALRFHLMPGTRTNHLAQKRAVLLVLPDGQAWRFDAGGLNVELEESVFFAAGNTMRRAEQMVVSFRLAQTPSVVWRLVRVRGPEPRRSATDPPRGAAPEASAD
jgi:uncharacterized heparinase superfamily protein